MVIVMDTETTGLHPNTDDLLQVSIIDGNGNTLLNEYVKPTRCSKWDSAMRIHHITPQMVADKPPFSTYKNRIQQIVDSADMIIGYNINFDIGFLESYGINFDGKEIVDVMMVFSDYYGEWNEYYGNYKWQKLTVACSHFGYVGADEDAHDSLADTKMTLFVYNKLKNKKLI